MWQPVTVPGLLLYSFIYRWGTFKVKPSMSVPFKARFLKKCLCHWFCSFSEWRLHSLFLHCWGNIQTHWFYRDCFTSGFIGMDKDTQGNVLTSLNVISVAAWNDGIRCKILSHFCIFKNEKCLPTDAFQHPTKATYAPRSIERVKHGFLFVNSTHHNSLTKTRKKRLIKIKTSLYRHKIVVAIYHSDVIIVSW